MFVPGKDYCTLWLDSLMGADWSMSCYQHDVDTSNPDMWFMLANWHLMRGVWASSYSNKCDNRIKQTTVRIVAVIMFVGTSTVGWFWRWKSLLLE